MLKLRNYKPKKSRRVKNSKRKISSWEELIKNYPCSSCDYAFTEQEIKEKNKITAAF